MDASQTFSTPQNLISPTSKRGQAFEWIAENPNVYLMFVRFALDMARVGKPFGINLLRERVRWECTYSYDPDDYKFCNTHSPYIARKLIEDYPTLQNFMRCKKTEDE